LLQEALNVAGAANGDFSDAINSRNTWKRSHTFVGIIYLRF